MNPLIVPGPPTLPTAHAGNGGERIIVQNAHIAITTARAVFGGVTYPIRNITSIRITYAPPSHGGGIALILLGGAVMVGSLKGMEPGIFWFLLGAGLIALGIYTISKAKTIYQLVVGNAGSEFIGTTSYSKPYIEGLYAAMNEAIVRYR